MDTVVDCRFSYGSFALFLQVSATFTSDCTCEIVKYTRSGILSAGFVFASCHVRQSTVPIITSNLVLLNSPFYPAVSEASHRAEHCDTI